MMSKIKSKDTMIEIKVRSWLHRNGYRFRKNDKRYAGTPDIVLPKYRTIIFINGCFWHGHEDCKIAHIPKVNSDFWLNKIKKNKLRDEKNIMDLIGDGWRVITVWECEIDGDFEKVMKGIADSLKN